MVAADEAGERLDRVLAARVAELSRSRLKALILAGRVAIDGATIRDPGHRVNAGGTIVLDGSAARGAAIAAEDIPLKVVYEDDELIVIDKPAGLVVHPAAGNCDRHAGQCAGRPLRGEPVRHRRGQASRHRASARQGHHRADGGGQDRPRPSRRSRRSSPTMAAAGRCGAATWPSSGARRSGRAAPSTRRSTAIRTPATGWRCAPAAAPAITHWEVLERYPGTDGKPVASLVACRLETGRTHQIRVHLAPIGHPLLGDAVYGRGFKTKANRLGPEAQAALEALGRQALHAYLLAIEHPIAGEVWSSDRNCRTILLVYAHALVAAGRLGAEPKDLSESMA